MRAITQALLEALIERAHQSERKRVPYNLHEYHETVQRMVNARSTSSRLPTSPVTRESKFDFEPPSRQVRQVFLK